MNSFWQEVRFSFRMFVKNPVFTLVIVVTLALGIGANTAIFSLVDAVLLKKLPVREPDHVVLFKSLAPPNFDPGGYNGSTHLDAATGLRAAADDLHTGPAC